MQTKAKIKQGVGRPVSVTFLAPLGPTRGHFSPLLYPSFPQVAASAPTGSTMDLALISSLSSAFLHPSPALSFPQKEKEPQPQAASLGRHSFRELGSTIKSSLFPISPCLSRKWTSFSNNQKPLQMFSPNKRASPPQMNFSSILSITMTTTEGLTVYVNGLWFLLVINISEQVVPGHRTGSKHTNVTMSRALLWALPLSSIKAAWDLGPQILCKEKLLFISPKV